MSSYAASMPETGRPTSAELSHAAIGQWGGVIAGILAGFATTVVLGTLGSAFGFTAGSASLGAAGPRDAGSAIGAGLVVWTLVMAVVVGLVGGTVLARSSRPDRSYNPRTLGLVTWAGGILLAALIATPTAVGAWNGLGSTMVAANRVERVAVRSENTLPATAAENGRRPVDTLATQAAADAARAATVAAWVVFLAQLLSLGATVFAARWQRRKVLETPAAPYAGDVVRTPT